MQKKNSFETMSSFLNDFSIDKKQSTDHNSGLQNSIKDMNVSRKIDSPIEFDPIRPVNKGIKDTILSAFRRTPKIVESVKPVGSEQGNLFKANVHRTPMEDPVEQILRPKVVTQESMFPDVVKPSAVETPTVFKPRPVKKVVVQNKPVKPEIPKVSESNNVVETPESPLRRIKRRIMGGAGLLGTGGMVGYGLGGIENKGIGQKIVLLGEKEIGKEGKKLKNVVYERGLEWNHRYHRANKIGEDLSKETE